MILAVISLIGRLVLHTLTAMAILTIKVMERSLLHVRSQLPVKRGEIVLRVERAIRMALLRRGGIPSQFTGHHVHNGVLTLVVAGEFEV